MSTFLYAPGIQVFVNVEPERGKRETIDISDDLISGNLTRRSDGVSTFQFSLQNTRRKYDSVFKPNDRIVVNMKRLGWVRVFTGYLNKVPLLSSWPRTVELEASCSLKRLQHWYWDPGLPATFDLVTSALTDEETHRDGGIANAATKILTDVVGWPEEKIHIGAIPPNWFDFAKMVAEDVGRRVEESDALAEEYYNILSGGGNVGGMGGMVDGQLAAGSYGGSEPLDQEQARNATIVYNVGQRMGMSKREIIVGLLVAYQESRFRALNHGDTAGPDSRGLFQQRSHWGSLEDRMDPTRSSEIFYEAYKQAIQQGNWEGRRPKGGSFATAPLEDVAEAIQGFAAWTKPHYKAAIPYAEAIYSTLSGMSPATGNTGSKAVGNRQDRNQTNPEPSGTGATVNRPTPGSTGAMTGTALLTTALQLTNKYPNMPYTWGGGRAWANKDYDKMSIDDAGRMGLDCSGFVMFCMHYTFGNAHSMAWTTSQVQASKVREIPIQQALNTRGALLFGGGGPGSATHVEISQGDGGSTVGSRSRRSGTRQFPPGYNWTYAGLIPELDYSADGGGVGLGDVGTGGAGGTPEQIAIEKYRDQAWFREEDEIDAIFGESNWVPQMDPMAAVRSSSFTGIRALMNDEPLLPYIKNMMNSTLRSLSSAPNGDFIAWFPDYYGIYGTAAIMNIETIELQDFQVDWRDDFFVTHQFTQAAVFNKFNTVTGMGASGTLLPAVSTIGIASIDVPSILYSVLGIEVDKAEAREFAQWIYERFGARPNFDQMPGMVDKRGEFFSALHLFMKNWAYQYSANIPITFMPELWPGMLIQIPAFDFQAYVVAVTHSFKFGPDGHFSTSVNIAAPARMPQSADDRNHALLGLPMAGGLRFGGQGLNLRNPSQGSGDPGQSQGNLLRRQ